MVDLSMGLSAFMSQIEDKLSSKADVKALLQKASWTEVRDLMADLSAHMGEKIYHTSTEIKGLQQKISNIGDTGGNALGVMKCISCSRPIAAVKTEGHVHFWSKNPMYPELMSGGDAHVQRIKTVNAHLHHADKMPAIDGARPSAVQALQGWGTVEDGKSLLRTAKKSPKRGPGPGGKYVPWTPEDNGLA